jgi:hypothetical protein
MGDGKSTLTAAGTFLCRGENGAIEWCSPVS